MASTPEAKVKAFVDKHMKLKYPDAWRYCPPGGAFGQAGVPDRIYLVNGILVAIECKDVGRNPTPLQTKCLLHIHNSGGIAAVMRGRDMDKMNLIFQYVDQAIQQRGIVSDSKSDV